MTSKREAGSPKYNRSVQFVVEESTDYGKPTESSPVGNSEASNALAAALESTPSIGGRSARSDYGGVGTDVTLAEEYFDYYRGEAYYIVRCFVLECNRHWRHAVRDLGSGKAPLRFRANEEIQKNNSLSASETRNILLGHSARVVDPWTGFVKTMKERALAVVSKCLESAYCPRLQPTNSSILSVGVEDAESFVDLEEMAYVHVWKSRREGRAFQHALRALSQMRQDVLLPPIVAAPFSVAIVFQCRFITVTWMPPLVHSRPQSIEGGILAQVEEVWRRAVGVDTPNVRIPFYAGGDGRYYSITVDILADSNRTLTPETTLHERFEYNCRDDLVEFVRTGEGASNEAHTKNGIEDRLLPALQRKMKDIKTLLNSPPHFISNLFHNCGVNLQLLLHVRDRFATQVNERKDQLVSLLTVGDFSRAKQFILESIDNEVVARTLKCLILGAVAQATRSYAPYSREDMSDVILRCANSTVSGFLRSGKFLKDVLLPAVEKKFVKAPDFVLDMDKVHMLKVMRHLEERLGLQFDPQQKKFVKSAVQPIFLSNSGRKAVPHCPLNDAAVVALEFLTAQKSWRRGQPMVRRMVATLMSVGVSATGINLSIDGCFTIFTEALCEVLSRHEREQKKFLTGFGGGVSNASITSVPLQTPKSVGTGGFTSVSGHQENGIVPHLLLIGIMGEIVQSESPAVTASELEFLCRIRVMEFADKMFIAERCMQLFSFFSSPKGMVTVRIDDTDTRVKVLSLWGRSIMRGIENVAHQPQIDKQADPKRLYERVLGKYPLPTAKNLDAFLSLVTSDDLMLAIARTAPEVRSDIIRAFVAASTVVKNTTSEKCARVIISFCDAVYDDIFEELHPTLADSLCALHDELPRGSAMAFMIAMIVAPTLMHHPGSARLAMDVGGIIRQLKAVKRLLLPDEGDVFPIVSQGKVLYQVVLNISEGKERAEDEALYQQVLEDERQVSAPRPTSATFVGSEGDEDENPDDVDDAASEVFSVTTAMLSSLRPPGHILMTKWLGEFLERPECLELLERYRIELVYQQQHIIKHEEVRRTVFLLREEKFRLQHVEMRQRQLLTRQVYHDYLSLCESYLRFTMVEMYERRFRCVLHEFHDRTMYRLTRLQEFQHLVLIILNVVCQQKIAERVARQEAEARVRRETKYLFVLTEVVEEGHRAVLQHLEHDAIRHAVLPAHGNTLLIADHGWRATAQLQWLSTVLELKHFERYQQMSGAALGAALVMHEAITRFDRERRMERDLVSRVEGVERWVLMQRQVHAHATYLDEHHHRLRILYDEGRQRRLDLSTAHSDICVYESSEMLKQLNANVGSFYQNKFRDWLCGWWDIYVTMQRFILVQLDEITTRTRVLAPLAAELNASARRDTHHRFAKEEAFARYRILQEYKLVVFLCSEAKAREVGIVAKEREAFHMRLQAYKNRILTAEKHESLERLRDQEASARRDIALSSRPTNTWLVQLQSIAFAMLEDIKRHERRHFAAILAVVGIEEVAGQRQHTEEHRQTTQQRWRLVDIETQVRHRFVLEECMNRFWFNEMHHRLSVYADEDFERTEWWYLFQDTTVLLWQHARIADLGRPPQYASPAQSLRTTAVTSVEVASPTFSPCPPQGSSGALLFRRQSASSLSSRQAPPTYGNDLLRRPHLDMLSRTEPVPGRSSAAYLHTPSYASSPMVSSSPRTPNSAPRPTSGVDTTYMAHLLNRFDADTLARSGRRSSAAQLKRSEGTLVASATAPMFPAIGVHRSF